ncbi:hypothetical protein NDU88_010796 [Pleurodeles waltl]|uniref:Uncharacterized protein n=1 Tax=Pleurodeles waltl TaxID=8319 RepID=A0AAV7QYK5_PLEWA|nr:hypothetical protein NDU88_010795 [Pleurodeles waltl]KAJ1144498.1 hypothetical protein NDU88_010796 [Pleurodeles waltl]
MVHRRLTRGKWAAGFEGENLRKGDPDAGCPKPVKRSCSESAGGPERSRGLPLPLEEEWPQKRDEEALREGAESLDARDRVLDYEPCKFHRCGSSDRVAQAETYPRRGSGRKILNLEVEGLSPEGYIGAPGGRMEKDQLQRGAQANKIVQYTVTGQETGDREEERQRSPHKRPQAQDTQEILEAICGTRVALECKMGTMAMDINHLRLDLCKVAERVTSTEEEVIELKGKVQTLQATVDTLQSAATRMEICVENAEGHSHRNNL